MNEGLLHFMGQIGPHEWKCECGRHIRYDTSLHEWLLISPGDQYTFHRTIITEDGVSPVTDFGTKH